MIGDRIKAERRARGWTQRDLAERAGSTENYIALLEQNRRPNPTYKTLEKLARAFEIAVDDLRKEADSDESASIETLRAENLPPEIIEELARRWPGMLPDDRQAVLDLARVLWERRQRQAKINRTVEA